MACGPSVPRSLERLIKMENLGSLDTLAHAQAALETLRTSSWGNRDYHDAHEFIFKLLESDFRHWIAVHTHDTTDYTEATPRRAVYLYHDSLLPPFDHNSTVYEILFNGPHFEKLVTRALLSLKTSSRKSEKERVVEKFPEYSDLLKTIRETKKQWNKDDAAIKQTQAFRMMGGLARLGSRAGAEYSHLVAKAQSMEKSVLGKILTSHTRAH